jgi:glucosyl-dolichyl phosphate glucuronosyltransferase
MARIAVIICTHNRAADLRAALESLTHQTLPPTAFETIVVDNASTDDTARIRSQFCRAPARTALSSRGAAGLVVGAQRGRGCD